MTFAPQIKTERLILRHMTEHDLDDYARICADPETVRFIGDGQPLDRAAAWRSMAFLLGHWTIRGYGMWAVVQRDLGRFIGRIGLHNPEGWPGLEVGWMIDRAFRGQGYATEGGRVALGFAFQNLGVPRVISLIHPDNQPSIRVAEKLEGVLAGEETVGGQGALVYEYR
ncbi:MAG: GNAT family N-acetyltransferase [Candidatus Hydrogenedentes bacterium]|nr:GNAT family N-acetyltransferase [Candidatus Hydrogenedentota bacterium]